MQEGIVIGTATSTKKHPSLNRTKLLVVQMLAAGGKSPDGEPVLSIDQLGAGVGERVLVTSDGRYVRDLLGENTPVRWSIMGLPDAKQ